MIILAMGILTPNIINYKLTRYTRNLSKGAFVRLRRMHPPCAKKTSIFCTGRGLFNKVQKLLEERQPKNQAAQVTASQYLLSGLMKCGKCGGAYGVTGYGRNKKYAYYNCITYSKKGKDVCPGHRVRADALDKEIIDRLKTLIFSDGNMKKLADDINTATKSLRIDYGKKITELKKKASDVQRRIMNQYEAIEGGIINVSLVAPRLEELKSQKDSLQEEIYYYESLNSQNHPVYITKSMIDKFRKEMEQIFVGDNVQEKRDFLKKFIEKIIVRDKEIEIVYFAPGAKFPDFS